jgi:hypothetical protein
MPLTTDQRIMFDYLGGEDLCKRYLSQLNLQDYFASVVLVGLPPGKSLPIHIDSGERIFTLLYGLTGNNHMEWITYDVGRTQAEPNPLSEESSHNVYWKFEESDVVAEIARQKFDKVFVANIKKPHTVKNTSLTESAFCISMRLTPSFSTNIIEEMCYVQ